jgi:probable HAF family extracellular repeat protein
MTPHADRPLRSGLRGATSERRRGGAAPDTRNRTRRHLLGCLVATLLLAACGGEVTAPGVLDRVIIDRPVASTLFVNQSVDLRAVALSRDSVEVVDLTRRIVWESDNPEVATVDSATGVVVARAPGVAIIRAKVNDKTDEVTFQVSYAVASVSVALPAGDSVRVQDDLTVCAAARADDGTEIAGAAANWTVSDQSVASPSPATGACTTLRGATTGAITVTAEIGGKQAETTVRVIARVARLTVGAISGPVTAGDCRALNAVASDAAGAPLNRTITYRSSDERVATVDQATGTACWETPGSATISAESEGAGGEVRVTVEPTPLTVVGYADLASETRRAFKWTEAGGLQELPALPNGVSALAKGVNDNGHIVGETTTADGVRHAFVYTAGRGIRELPAPAGATGAEAEAVNNSGQVGGSAFFPDGTQRLMVWVVSGAQITLVPGTTSPGGTKANTEGLSGTGAIAGTGNDATGRSRAYRASVNGPIRLFDRLPDERSSEATAINYRGDIVGFYDDTAGTRRPFVALHGYGMQTFELPPGCPEGVAYGIDAEGRMIVTGLNCTGGKDRGYVRTVSGRYIELYDGHTQARGMNEAGDVVGWTLVAGRNQAFLWRRGAATGTLLGRFGDGQRSNAVALNGGK